MVGVRAVLTPSILKRGELEHGRAAEKCPAGSQGKPADPAANPVSHGDVRDCLLRPAALEAVADSNYRPRFL
ncbi:hypothetical protein SDC9_111131 [bioreactor metagenome]|uniref:Uncharacterized protein n=1 Tax=bioreactor metagenome TaxID=1076179 RepID=A0A645BFN0_9ZZZZ